MRPETGAQENDKHNEEGNEMTRTLRRTALGLAVLSAMAPAAWATNGMNLEGYGPIATAMGGAVQTYDNGTAFYMPALGLARAPLLSASPIKACRRDPPLPSPAA